MFPKGQSSTKLEGKRCNAVGRSFCDFGEFPSRSTYGPLGTQGALVHNALLKIWPLYLGT